MKVEWWWLFVVAALVWWWRGQRDELAAVKSTPGYKAAVAAGMDPLNQKNVQTVAPGASIDIVTNAVTNPQGASAFSAD
jgi:hypothetical protein